MSERPILTMPRPVTRNPIPGRPPLENVTSAHGDRQAERIGPKFERLEQSLGSPDLLAELRDDPAAIVPERALVFEVASNVADFYRAIRSVPSLEFLGEDEGEASADDDFCVMDREGELARDKSVPRRYYFTIPDQTALRELVSLWRRFQLGEELGKGRTAWRDVFGHLADIRPWGPEDRLTSETIRDWKERLEFDPESPIRFEVEYWFRASTEKRNTVETKFAKKLKEVGGKILDRSVIAEIRYHSNLVEVAPIVIQDLFQFPRVGLVAIDDVMMLRPQSMVSGPIDVNLGDSHEITTRDKTEEILDTPFAALLDGVPMSQHERLTNRLVIDDPDNFSNEYGSALEQRHGTAMASLILHGDLNSPTQVSPVKRRLYVRPVMYPQPAGFDEVRESMPPQKLGIDLIWRAFIRMFDGEAGEEPTAPTIRIVNLSLGDSKRQFTGVMSPWARLIDHLAWRYNVLILVSAGNITDRVSLRNINKWEDFESAEIGERQAILLRAILRHRANRRLLAPSEAINALTIGAAHKDHLPPNGHGILAVDPYTSSALPNLSSALGLGLKRTIKPEILFPGGAEQVRTSNTQGPIDVVPSSQPANYFGIGVANPGPTGQTNRKVNMSGTSVATALATHSALRIYEALEGLPNSPEHPNIDPTYYSVVLKALLVHSARWDGETAKLLDEIVNEGRKLHWEHARDEISRFLGFGSPEIERVIDCAENRATLIGWNSIRSRKVDRFSIPLPAELEGIAGYRAFSVTIAWLTPINLSNRMYRLAKFKASPGADKSFSIGVSNSKQQPSHNTLGKGSVYHHRWEGGDAAIFVDNGKLILDITCSPVAGELDEEIRYAVVATIEVGQGVAVPVYDRVREQIRDAVGVRI